MRPTITNLGFIVLTVIAGCDGGSTDKAAENTPTTAPTPTAPELEATVPGPPPLPPGGGPPAPPMPKTSLDITGVFEFHGKLAIACSDANPISKPTQQPPTGWQMRGQTPSPADPALPAVRFNFHNGESKSPGEQVIGYPGQGQATSAIEFSAGEGGPWTSYFAMPGRVKFVLGADLKTATIEGTYADAIDESKVIEVKASVECQ